MLAPYMNGTYEARGRWTDKIAFFSLFIVVLLIAYFIVAWKSAILLSKPIELNCAGLSVCMPTGDGWRGGKQWRYQQNIFTLDSFFDLGPGNITTLVSCRYRLAAGETNPETLFEEKASAVSGSKITKTGQITNTPLNAGFPALNWAHIENLAGGEQEKTPFDMFFGVMQLSNNRRLDIEVYHDTGDTELAEKIFKSIAGSLKFTENNLLYVGSKIVAGIKDKGLDSFLVYGGSKQVQDGESFFMIKDAREHTIGFTMDVLDSNFAERPQEGAAVEPVPEAQLNIRAWSFYYICGRNEQEQITFFQSNNNFSEFVWKSETSGPSGRSGVEVVLDKDGTMTVKESDLQATEKDYKISPAAIPDVLGKFLFSQMLDGNQKEILVDIIGADGKITPTLVSRIEVSPSTASQNRSGGADAAKEEALYLFKMKFLDGRGFSQQVYLDDQRRISRMLLQQESTYTLERTDAENILREFPEQGSYILQRKDKVLEGNRRQEGSEQRLPTASY